LEAILTCEEDHVRFVADEFAGVVKSQQRPIDILRAYIQENHNKFIDLQKDKLPRNHHHASCPGYINEHDGRTEYLFSEEKLQEIMGSRGAADKLKQQLHSEGLNSTVSAGEGKYRYSLSMAETNCAKWRRESVPVGLREKGFEARCYFCFC
jgi:hypothetical protein